MKVNDFTRKYKDYTSTLKNNLEEKEPTQRMNNIVEKLLIEEKQKVEE